VLWSRFNLRVRPERANTRMGVPGVQGSRRARVCPGGRVGAWGEPIRARGALVAERGLLGEREG